MLKCSDGTQEESTTLNTFPVGGGVARQTHTNGKRVSRFNFLSSVSFRLYRDIVMEPLQPLLPPTGLP